MVMKSNDLTQANQFVGMGAWNLFFHLVFGRQPFKATLLFLTASGAVILLSLEPLLIKQLFDLFQLGIERNNLSLIQSEGLYIFLLITIVWLGSFVINIIGEWIELKTSPAAQVDIQNLFFEFAIKHTNDLIQLKQAGAISFHIKSAGTSISTLITLILYDFARLITATVMVLIIALHLPYEFILAIFIWLCVYCFGSFYFAKKTTNLFQEYSSVGAKSAGFVTDVLSSIDVVHSFNAHEKERYGFSKELHSEKEKSVRNRMLIIKMNTFITGSALFFQISLIFYAIYLFQYGKLSLGDVALVISLMAMLIANVNGLCRQFLSFFEQIGTLASSINAVFQIPKHTKDEGKYELRISSGEISIKNLSFGYEEGCNVFSNLNLEIKSGEKLGITGPSGCGKSTLLKILTRQHQPDLGAVLIDGHDINNVTFSSLNSGIALIGQEPSLFNRSVSDNIFYPEEHLSVDWSHKLSMLSQYGNVFTTLIHKLNFVVGFKGSRLSGGERQRVAIARALSKKSAIFLFDEFTSALDASVESQLSQILDNVLVQYTVIIVAHRLSSLKKMDRILYFEQGCIIEEGTHDELIKKKGSYYKNWVLQS